VIDINRYRSDATLMPRQLATKDISLQLSDAETRFIVISDTHSSPHKNALSFISRHKPHYILHAGDIGSLDVIDMFSKVAPVIHVRGNIDGIGHDLPDFVKLTIISAEQNTQKWLLTHIALRGPKLLSKVEKHARKLSAQLVICGHSHMPFMSKQNGIAVFNPGSIGPKRFGLPIVFGLITFTNHGCTLQHFDCETGHRWSPPSTNSTI